jgi:alpha-glucosidase
VTDDARPLTKDPNWYRQAVVYQIYPRSFADSDSDGIGDLRGITSRVPYLAKLGVDAVWLSPFYPSELADGGYDVADYRNVDPRLGTLDDFDEMISAFHAAGIRMFVDIVPNHSSDQHEWFQAALKAGPGSPERERYVFRKGLGAHGEMPPSDWPSHFGPTAWTRLPDGDWYLHLFAPEQPDFNWDHPDVREDFRTTLRFWSDRGVDGFRIDVAHALTKDLTEPLRSKPAFIDFDNPLSGDDVLFDRDEVHEIYRDWRSVFNEYEPPRVAVAEAYVRAERRMQYARADGLGQAFNFDLLASHWDEKLWRTVIADNIDLAASVGASSTWVLSNHDKVRHASRLMLPAGNDGMPWVDSEGTDPVIDREAGLRRARAATLLMLALPGSSYLYQGEELGLHEVADLPRESLQDPIWLRTGHLHKGRDGCRVPIPWTTDTPSFGFGSAPAHLPQPEWFAESAASVQDGVAGSTLELYREALAERRRLLADENLTWVDDAAGVLHIARAGGWHSITNFGASPVTLPTGELRVVSAPLVDGRLATDATAWVVVH